MSLIGSSFSMLPSVISSVPLLDLIIFKMQYLYSTNTDSDVMHKVLFLRISIWKLQYTNLYRRRLSIQMQFYSNHKYTKHLGHSKHSLYMIRLATIILYKPPSHNNMAGYFRKYPLNAVLHISILSSNFARRHRLCLR